MRRLLRHNPLPPLSRGTLNQNQWPVILVSCYLCSCSAAGARAPVRALLDQGPGSSLQQDLSIGSQGSKDKEIRVRQQFWI